MLYILPDTSYMRIREYLTGILFVTAVPQDDEYVYRCREKTPYYTSSGMPHVYGCTQRSR